MNAFVRWLLLVAAAKAQLILPLIERPFLTAPPLEVRAFRIDSDRWAVVSRIERPDWRDYAFDSLMEVKFRLYGESGQLAAETLLSLPSALNWRGHFHWHLPPTFAGKWAYLEVFPNELPEKACYDRLYLPENAVQSYLLHEGAWLNTPITLIDTRGSLHQVVPGDSMWKVFFEPAQVDTAWPVLPYILTGYKSRWANVPCAWYLKGDSSEIFWTCALTGAPPKKLTLNPARQEEARRRFAGLKPGDRTDFGLIYASWGPPDLRIFTTSMETWVYTQQKISFTFDRRGREWILQRRMEYQAVWK